MATISGSRLGKREGGQTGAGGKCLQRPFNNMQR
jgi:hypothetical protein